MVIIGISGCGHMQKTESETDAKSESVDESSVQEAESETQMTEISQSTEIDSGTEITEMIDNDRNLIIELDPGHGGEACGAVNKTRGICEDDINLKIARYLKEELEQYEHVTVYLTRDGDYNVDLEKRVQKAIDDKADILISLHNNGKGTITDYYNGSTVLVQRGAYHQENAQITQEVGCYILHALSEIGLENQGLMFRVSQNGNIYPNGESTDYYSIVRNCEMFAIPGIIVEHGFLDNENDCSRFFSSDEQLRIVAQADARGIASYYRLIGKNEEKELFVLKDHREKIVLITTDYSKDNEYFDKLYFAK